MERALNDLKRACEDGTNTMYPIMEAVKAYATVGEMCDAMRDVFGEFQEPSV